MKRRIVLGVTGGIAAYKACLLLRLLTEAGHDVRVVPTAAALEFVGAPTWAALSGHPVTTTVWDDVHEVAHVRIGPGEPSSRGAGATSVSGPSTGSSIVSKLRRACTCGSASRPTS